jgi:hypothetical protein
MAQTFFLPFIIAPMFDVRFVVIKQVQKRSSYEHYTREGHHWRFKTPLNWWILNRHNQLGSDKLITSLPVMPNRQ